MVLFSKHFNYFVAIYNLYAYNFYDDLFSINVNKNIFTGSKY